MGDGITLPEKPIFARPMSAGMIPACAARGKSGKSAAAESLLIFDSSLF
jgi:hypothetical protein